MACIYSLGDATIDLPGVMRSGQLWKWIVIPKIEETVHKEFGSATDSKFIAFHNHECNKPGFWRSQKYELFKNFPAMCEACRC